MTSLRETKKDADTDKFETESNQSESTVISNVSSKGKGLKLSPRCRIARKLARNAHASKACCELVSVTHIKSPCHFMIQRCSDHDKFESMRRAINKHCNDVKAELVEDVDVGELFCSQYNVDRHWYRARVKSIVDTNDNDSGEEMVEVVYVDYGNTEIVPISRLRKLKTKYLNSPELAVHCSLVDIVPTEGDTWSDEVRLAFAQMVSNKPVLMTVVNHIGGMLYVDLQKPPSDDIDNDVPVSVRDAMVFLELANFVSPASKPLPGMPRLTPPRKFIQPSVPKKEDFVDSLVSHISSPDTIYIQKLLPELSYLTSLMHEMQTTFNKDRGDVWQILLPQIGMICAAKYDMDNAWYRAQIIGLPGKRQVEVIYVDYGNTEIIDTTKLQKIPDDFCRLEVQALKCTLADITPVEDDWTENARVRLHSLVQNKSLVAHVQAVTDNIPSIVLYDTSSKVDVCINAVLVSEDLATSTGPGSVSSKAVTKPAPVIEKSEDSEDECSPVGPVGTAHKHPAKYKPKVIPPDHLSYTQVLVSHIESPSCIYVQLATAEEDGLDCLMKMMTAHYNQIAGEPKADMEWKQGVICAALFVQGDVWCRARLCTLLPGNLCLVLYIDYGNSEVTSMSNIRVLQEEFKKPPPFAMCCSLAGIQPAGGKDWTKTACEFLVTLICGVECYLIGKDPDGSGDGDSNTLPIDLLYEMPEEVTDLTEDPEPVLISAAKTLTLQGLALPVKMKPGQEASSDRLSVAILGKKIEENSAEKSKVNKMVSSPDVLENKAVSLLKLEQGNDVILLEEDKHSDHSNDDIGIFDDADDSESEEEDKDSGEKESDMSDDISTHTEIEKVDTDMPVLATDVMDGSDDEPATKAGDVAGMATRESRSEEDTSNVVTSISPDSVEREHYKPSDLPKSNVITLSVTYVDSTGMIYGHQITQGNKTLLQVMENLQTKFKDSLPSPSGYEWQIGQPCSALFTEDMHWYRAKILDITDQGVEVSYIDFGNTETVQKHNLRLEAVDLEIPQQCLQCVLHGITPNSGSGQWCKEAIYFLIETLLGNIVTVLIKKPAMIGEPLQVDVQTENSASLSQVMVHQGWARCFSDSIDIKDVNANPMKSVYKQPTLPDVGTFFSISVTQINNPAEICFQRLGPKGKGDNAASGAVHQYEELERISSEMNKRADEFELIENPVPGMACCGQYTFDDEWYRAEILKVKSVSPLKVEVTYVDYGTAETIGVDRLRKLPDEFKALPMQAIKSELIGLKPPTQVPDGVAMVADTNWPQGSQLAMTNLVMAKRLIACIMEVGSPVKVLLYQSLPSDKGSSLAFQPLVEQGLAELDVTTINQFIKEFPNIVSHSKMAATRAASPTAP
ncbi:RING finger protein 17-like [Glandiceps talaboti]